MNDNATSTSGGPDALLNPDDPRQLGLLVGLTGGKIADAATARFAVALYEKTYHRKPSLRDAGTLMALLAATRP